MIEGVSSEPNKWFKGVLMEINEKGFQGFLKDVTRVLEFSRKFLLRESLESVTRKIQKGFKGVSREFQEYFKEV